AFRTHDEIDDGERGDGVASENLFQASAQAVAGHRGELKAGHHDCDPRVVQRTRAPRQVEMRGAQAATLFPASSELRTAREAHAVRSSLLAGNRVAACAPRISTWRGARVRWTTCGWRSWFPAFSSPRWPATACADA